MTDKTPLPSDLQKILNEVIHEDGILPRLFEFLIRTALYETNKGPVLTPAIASTLKCEDNAVTKGIQRLNKKLGDYYRVNKAIDNKVAIINSGNGYQAVYYEYIDQRSIADAQAHQSDHVECFYEGSDQAGMEYVRRRLPDLWMLRDTHVRPREGHARYNKKYLRKFEQSLKEFLSQESENQLMLIAGHTVEEEYIKTFARASEEHKNKIQCYRLQYPGTWLNFIILDYANRDLPSEVLFGFGRQNLSSKEAVFRSSDPRLVNEFNNLFESLIKMSEKMPNIKEVSDPPKNISESAKITPWSQDRIYQLLRGTEPGTEVRMLTTLFIDWTVIRPIVMELRKKGVHIKIVMMDPSNLALVKARFERRTDRPPINAERELKIQLADLEQLCEEQDFKGSLEVQRSNIMPFGFFIQSGNTIVMGFLPPLSAYHECPMIEVEANSLLGQNLEKNWLGYWDIRSGAELEKLEGSNDVEEVWLATPNFSNDTGKWAQFKKVVRRNAERGVKYTVIFPERQLREKRLQEFRELFPLDRKTKQRLGITEIPLENSKFSQLLANQRPLPHIVIFNPNQENDQSANLYVTVPGEAGIATLWRKMDGDEAKTILDKFIGIIKPQS